MFMFPATVHPCLNRRDSSLRQFGVRKKSEFQKLVGRKNITKKFLTLRKGTGNVARIGGKAMTVLFGGRSTDSLTSLRCKPSSKKPLRSGVKVYATPFVSPELLPPTESLSKYHCFRVYFQIMIWTGNYTVMNVGGSQWTIYIFQLSLIILLHQTGFFAPSIATV